MSGGDFIEKRMGLSKLSLWIALGLACLQAMAGSSRATEIPPWLPQYDLAISLDVEHAKVQVRQIVTWHNRHRRPATDLIFNAHAHYAIRPDEIGFGAKTLEILRMAPSEGLDLEGPALEVERVLLGGKEVAFSFLQENPTALRVELGRTIAQGESVVVELDYHPCSLPPPKQGALKTGGRASRFSPTGSLCWRFTTKMAGNTSPTFPGLSPCGEARLYSVSRLTVAEDQKVACSLPVTQERPTIEGMKEVHFAPQCLRDFALLTSSLYEIIEVKEGDVTIRCLALPEHHFYAEKMVQWVSEALPIYTRHG